MVRPAHQKDARQNCSDILPFSADFYAVVGSETLYFIYVDVVLTLVVWLLFVEECYFVLRTYKHYNIAIKSIWLISIYPAQPYVRAGVDIPDCHPYACHPVHRSCALG
nr:hypothetical protein BaRGS_023581 [Batillaria attramentaria]